MVDIGAACGIDAVCEDPQAECVDGTCQCISGYYSNNGTCQSREYDTDSNSTMLFFRITGETN